MRQSKPSDPGKPLIVDQRRRTYLLTRRAFGSLVTGWCHERSPQTPGTKLRHRVCDHRAQNPPRSVNHTLFQFNPLTDRPPKTSNLNPPFVVQLSVRSGGVPRKPPDLTKDLTGRPNEILYITVGKMVGRFDATFNHARGTP